MINVLRWIGFISMWFIVYGCLVTIVGLAVFLCGIELDVIFIAAIGVIWTSLVADDLAYVFKI